MQIAEDTHTACSRPDQRTSVPSRLDAFASGSLVERLGDGLFPVLVIPKNQGHPRRLSQYSVGQQAAPAEPGPAKPVRGGGMCWDGGLVQWSPEDADTESGKPYESRSALSLSAGASRFPTVLRI
jgi:hypothetical protein